MSPITQVLKDAGGYTRRIPHAARLLEEAGTRDGRSRLMLLASLVLLPVVAAVVMLVSSLPGDEAGGEALITSDLVARTPSAVGIRPAQSGAIALPPSLLRAGRKATPSLAKPASTVHDLVAGALLLPSRGSSAFTVVEPSDLRASWSELAHRRVLRPRMADRAVLMTAAFAGPLDPTASGAYDDPVAGGAVPLVRVVGNEEVMLSANFKVKDFAARDGAPYARISPALVDAVERVQAVAGGLVHVNSAYRHPLHNASDEVGGAERSQHIAGLAADLSSTTLAPLELAEAALAALGCNIGIGLGATFVHVDLRGFPSSWATPTAAVEDKTFDAWVTNWCAESGGMPISWSSSGASPLPSIPETPVSAASDPVQRASSEELSPELRFKNEIKAYSNVQRRKGVVGAVILRVGGSSALNVADGAAEYSLSFATQGSEEARLLKVGPLLERLSPEDHVVFVIISADGAATVGAMQRDL